jgi:hypothetical protein
VRTLGTIDRTLVILSDLIRGALYDRHAIAQTIGCSLPVADRYIKALAAVPGVKVNRDRRRQILSWRIADAARAASPELGELVRQALEERAAAPLPRAMATTAPEPPPITEYFYGYQVRADVAIRMEKNIRIGLMFALRANGETLAAIGREMKISRERVRSLLEVAQRKIEKAADRRFPLPEEPVPPEILRTRPQPDHRERERLEVARKDRETWGRIRAQVFLLRSNGATIGETAELVGLPEATVFYFDQLLAQGIEEAWRLFQLGDGPWAPGSVFSAPTWREMGPRGGRLTCAVPGGPLWPPLQVSSS